MYLKSSATTIIGRDIMLPSVPKGKKLVLVLVTSTPMTETRGEAVETAETARKSKDSKESKGEYLNLA